MVAQGMTNMEVAKMLWISPGTVRKHLGNVYAKLGVHTRTGAIAAVFVARASKGPEERRRRGVRIAEA